MVKQRLVVGAHYGFKRLAAAAPITAVVMALYTRNLRRARNHLHCRRYLPSTFPWCNLFSSGIHAFRHLFLFFMALFYHAWVGVQRHLHGLYVKPVYVRLALHAIVAFLLLGYAGWAAQILWRL